MFLLYTFPCFLVTCLLSSASFIGGDTYVEHAASPTIASSVAPLFDQGIALRFGADDRQLHHRSSQSRRHDSELCRKLRLDPVGDASAANEEPCRHVWL